MDRKTISAVMREMGRRGGKAGGKRGAEARAASLTPEQRTEIARNAARKRWANVKAAKKKKSQK